MSHPPQTRRRLLGHVLMNDGVLGGMAHSPQFFYRPRHLAAFL